MDVTVLLTAARAGVELVGRLWSLLEDNRPVYEMTQELGGGLHVIPEGATIDLISRHRWPKPQVRRIKGYYESSLIRLVQLEPKAIWYCSNYDGNWYIVDARIAVDVVAIRRGQNVAAHAAFYQPYLDASGPGGRVSVLPFDLRVVHRNRFNHREQTTTVMIRADGRLTQVAEAALP